MKKYWIDVTSEDNQHKAFIWEEDDGVGKGISHLFTVYGTEDESDNFDAAFDFIPEFDIESMPLYCYRLPCEGFTDLIERYSGYRPEYIVCEYKAELKVLRGEEHIGENLLELQIDGVPTVLFECGEMLMPTDEGMKIGKLAIETPYRAVFITHSHPDHAGLLKHNIAADAIYMGEATRDVLEYCNAIAPENTDKIVTFSDGQTVKVGDVEVTPYLCDHSAFDSYMLHIASHGHNWLYTGDFRANGRQDFPALLSKLPKNIDALICENTNGDRTAKSITEEEVEKQLTDIFSDKQPVFVLQSATNADRTVSVYKACVKTHRAFVMRLGQAEICRRLNDIPNPVNYTGCYVYTDRGMENKSHDEIRKTYRHKFIGMDSIAKMGKERITFDEEKNRFGFALEVSSRDAGYLQKLNGKLDLSGATLVYSMWRGYEQQTQMKEFLDTVRGLGINTVYLHASGHADADAILKLTEAVTPKRIIYVHGEAKESR